MREIKFRLRQDNKIVGYEKWYCGVKITDENPCGASPNWLYSKDGEYWNPTKIPHNKKDAYTGIPDKKGVEIYEGDVVRAKGERGLYLETVGEIIYDTEYGSFANRNSAGNTLLCDILQYTIEVIGNIYENGDLLKEDA